MKTITLGEKFVNIKLILEKHVLEFVKEIEKFY